MNIVCLIGRLTKDPEMRISQDGKAVVSFSLAVDRRIREDPADFIPCVAFGATAEHIANHYVKGQRMGLSGRIKTKRWSDNQGITRYGYDVIADSVFFADSRRDSDAAPATKTSTVETDPWA